MRKIELTNTERNVMVRLLSDECQKLQQLEEDNRFEFLTLKNIILTLTDDLSDVPWDTDLRWLITFERNRAKRMIKLIKANKDEDASDWEAYKDKIEAIAAQIIYEKFKN